MSQAEKLFSDPEKHSGPWNFGPRRSDSRTVRELIALACASWGKGAKYKLARNSGPHEAPRLELDASKAARRLGWKPRWRLETAVLKTAHWMSACSEGRDMLDFSLAQIAEYETL